MSASNALPGKHYKCVGCGRFEPTNRSTGESASFGSLSADANHIVSTM